MRHKLFIPIYKAIETWIDDELGRLHQICTQAELDSFCAENGHFLTYQCSYTGRMKEFPTRGKYMCSYCNRGIKIE